MGKVEITLETALSAGLNVGRDLENPAVELRGSGKVVFEGELGEQRCTVSTEG
jgi:hypothetical protein